MGWWVVGVGRLFNEEEPALPCLNSPIIQPFHQYPTSITSVCPCPFDTPN